MADLRPEEEPVVGPAAPVEVVFEFMFEEDLVLR